MKEESIVALWSAGISVTGTLLGTALGGFITWLLTRTTNKQQRELAEQAERSQQRATLVGLIIKMIDLSMEYPYLEKKDFCDSYPNISGHQHSKERYENFCCFVFNTLMIGFKHFNCEGKKLEEYLHVREIVLLHHKWWQMDRENLEYDQPFQDYIRSVIDRLRKENKIP
ncbi:MAG TPA: hypothetical protein VMF69_01455 [Gemmataceae bacterium]|nr:hypothetical protein [Gemmataceae bacterium]